MENTGRQKEVDDRAARMLEMFATQSFHSVRAIQRLNFTITLWVIRVKVTSSLKRLLDMTASAILVVLTSPIMLGTAIAIRLDSPGPIVFKQMRVGRWNTPFVCFKFRSMYIDAEARKEKLMAQNEATGPVFKMKRDPRVTKVGRIIRKLSIDELPQLFNVLHGDMSMVGPRPPVPKEVAQYTFDQLKRLDAIPGITGLQQISGRSDMTFKRWIELDMQYIAEQSLLKDIEIMFKTIPAVVSGRGAY